MKKILLVLLAMGWFLCGIAQEIEFETTVHDFGDVFHNASACYSFVFTNTGTEPLIVVKPRTLCGCVYASQTIEPIMPGRKGYVTVAYDTKRKIGKFNSTVTVNSNAINSSKVVLRILGNVMEMEEEIKISQKNGKWGLEDKDEKVIIPFLYESLRKLDVMYSMNHFDISRFVAEKNGKCGLIDKSNKTVIPFEYENLYFGGGNPMHINIVKKEKVGLADCITGQIIIPCEYDGVYSWISEFFIAKKGGKWGVIDINNKVIFEFESDRKPKLSGTTMIKQGGKWGLVGDYGEIIPCEYDNRGDLLKKAFQIACEK